MIIRGFERNVMGGIVYSLFIRGILYLLIDCRGKYCYWNVIVNFYYLIFLWS